jgi:hypothetical protein
MTGLIGSSLFVPFFSTPPYVVIHGKDWQPMVVSGVSERS